MNVYIYAGDIYCEDCGDDIRQQLISEGRAPYYPDDELSYDSDEFPKGPYPDGGGEADSPQHCGARDDCLNAVELDGCYKIGVLLENELTVDGRQYVREAICKGRKGEVAELWADFYRDIAC